MTTHLIIPDAHVKPDSDFSRFDILGMFISDLRPDVIVCLGDFSDMESLCSYDKGKKSFEGRRYQKDVASTIYAMSRVLMYIDKLNSKIKDSKKKLYKPRLIMCIGNHENRVNRVIQEEAQLEDTISLDDLQYEQFGWEIVPYEDTITVDGITYAHTFVKGYRPVSGVNHARALINKGHCSCTCGHSHLRSFAEDVTWEGRRVLGLVAGCYTDEYQNYAAQDNAYWWSGLVVKRNVKDGVYEPQFVSLDMLKEVYGKKRQLKNKPIKITKEMILNFESN